LVEPGEAVVDSASAPGAHASGPRAEGIPGPAAGLDDRHGPVDTAGFRTELAEYVQRRLRLLVDLLGAIAGVSVFLNLLTDSLVDEWRWSYLGDPQLHILAGAGVLAAVTHVALGRKKLDLRTLLLLDAGYFAVFVLVCLAIYAIEYHEGGGRGIALLGLLMVARAVMIPCTARRTWLLAVPALAALFALQAWHATAGHPVPSAYGPAAALPFSGLWWDTVAWDQIYLVISTVVAAVASRVNFALRLSAYAARRMGQYVLEERVGAGAMGEVFRARHALMRRPVAVKFIRGDLVGDAMLRRFEQEVRQTSRLTHPNTIAVFDYGQTGDGVFYYAMEWLEGADLERIVESTGPLPPARVVHVLAQACGALHEAHRRGLVHRDVKSSNLFLCERGLEHDVTKVMDFGLVRDTARTAPSVTGLGEVVGSPHTMSPEILRGEPVGPAADLYALAAVGCYLLTGKHVFDATTVAEFVSAHLMLEPVAPSARDPSCPRDLEAVLLRSLKKDPEERHEDAAAFRAALLACRDAGGWTQADAAAWWQAAGARLSRRGARPEPAEEEPVAPR
jgi:serine/threonine-protein kinase